MQVIGWVAVALMSVLIVASRKHYSVDVVIAWYVVPLVYWTLQRHWSTKRRFSDSATSLDELAAEEDIEMGLPMKASASCTFLPSRLQSLGPAEGCCSTITLSSAPQA